MELDFVRWLTESLPASDVIALGIGDDAALVDVPAGHQLVVAKDMVTDQVHFDLAEHTPQRIGRKALAVNLSDMAAMAARPLAALVSLNLPRGEAAGQLARQVTEGMLPLVERYGCPIIGGDTNVTGGPLVVSVTVLGIVEPERAWRRSGAEPGDRLLVTGKLGGSLLGHHLDFEPRVVEALQLARDYTIHAAMDLSDGLSLDLARMATASRVGAVVEVERLPISEAARQRAKLSGQATSEHALSDGEDFELLLAVPPDEATKLLAAQPLACGLTEIGQVTGDADAVLRLDAGQLTPLRATGFEHR